jgi:transcriptional regulator GlxA family with amidase domain
MLLKEQLLALMGLVARVASTPSPPKNFGIVLFRGVDVLDVMGPVEALQAVVHSTTLKTYMLAETLEPVSSGPSLPSMNPHNSTYPSLVPTHTFADPPPLDVLLVPGGLGTRAPNVSAVTDFIRDQYPRLQYLTTVCTGAGLAGKAGVLDGRYATTNKAAWETVKAMAPKAKLVAPARWVVDGNIWTSSGVGPNMLLLEDTAKRMLTRLTYSQVSAGIDMYLKFIETIWGKEIAANSTRMMEYDPHNQEDDAFTALYNISTPYKLPINTRA